MRELWWLEPAAKRFTAHGLSHGAYHELFTGSSGSYETPLLPGLQVDVAGVWRAHPTEEVVRWHGPTYPKQPHYPDDGIVYGALPLTPRVGLAPQPIRFEEFIAWTPEAKFEVLDGHIVIGHDEGTRGVMALMLMTFGLTETVRLLPEVWREALHHRTTGEDPLP